MFGHFSVLLTNQGLKKVLKVSKPPNERVYLKIFGHQYILQFNNVYLLGLEIVCLLKEKCIKTFNIYRLINFVYTSIVWKSERNETLMYAFY